LPEILLKSVESESVDIEKNHREYYTKEIQIAKEVWNKVGDGLTPNYDYRNIAKAFL
jgi:hypothetical protein